MNTFSEKIAQKKADEIKKILASKQAAFDVAQYSYWRARTPDYQVIYYTSGKVLIQGKNIDSLLTELELTKESLQTLSDEKYIGTDESGKGDFFGPLVVAGVQVNNENKNFLSEIGVKDSKKLDDKKILVLANKIKANCVHSVVVITPVKYNELYSKFNNLNKLLAWAHSRAIENILEKSPCNYALADKFGDESLIKNALMSKGKNIILNQMVRAEADIAVAAASILARAEFVKRMQEMENKFELNFSKGVSPQVISQAKSFIQKYSFDRLKEIAKMHFKTVKELTP